MDNVLDTISRVLQENNLQVKDIDMFCLSQLVYRNIEVIRKELGIEEDKSIYVADKYGYTYGNPPFLDLYEAIKQGKVKRGDILFLWTVGAGVQHIYLIMKY